MRALILLPFLFAVASAIKGVPTVTICSDATALLQNIQYTISPQNVVPGVTLNVSVTGTLTQGFADGQMHLTASFDGIPLVSKTQDLCSFTQIHCPVPAGPMHIDVVHQIPNLPISGIVGAKAMLKTLPAKLQIACVEVTVDI